MASDTRRAELTTEITVLRQEQLESFSLATYQGWTTVTNEAHDKRGKRIAALQRELDALDPSSEPES